MASSLRIAIPIVSAIFPVVVAATLPPTTPNGTAYMIAAFLAGWAGVGFGMDTKPWLRILIAVLYPFIAVLVILMASFYIFGDIGDV